MARLPAAVTDELVALQQAAVKLLVEAVTIADVTIVTNARPGWIDHSGRTFVPGLLETLQKFGVHVRHRPFLDPRVVHQPQTRSDSIMLIHRFLLQVVYAREAHDEEEVDPDAWKMSAFCNLVHTRHPARAADRSNAHYKAHMNTDARFRAVHLFIPLPSRRFLFPLKPRSTAFRCAVFLSPLCALCAFGLYRFRNSSPMPLPLLLNRWRRPESRRTKSTWSRSATR